MERGEVFLDKFPQLDGRIDLERVLEEAGMGEEAIEEMRRSEEEEREGLLEPEDIIEHLERVDKYVPFEVGQNDGKYEVASINERHRVIARLVLQGRSDKDIAKVVKMHPASIGIIRRSTMFKMHLDFMSAQLDVDALKVAKRIHSLAPIALQVQAELMLEGNEETRYKVSRDMLDRSGHKAPKRVIKTDVNDIIERLQRQGVIKDVLPSHSDGNPNGDTGESPTPDTP